MARDDLILRSALPGGSPTAPTGPAFPQFDTGASAPPIPTVSPPTPYIPGVMHGPGAPRLRRSRRSELAIWWREIDRVLLGLVLMLMLIGTLAVAAASPASARRLSNAAAHVDDLHFLMLELRFQVLGLAVMLGASLLSRGAARRAGIVLGAMMLLALIAVPVIGSNVNGARRWLNLGVSFQPSEFLKPAFVITLAWVLSWRPRDPDLPVTAIAIALLAVVATLLMLQPDFGATVLFASVWFVLILLSGLPLRKIVMTGVAAVIAVAAAYLFYANARHRIDAFLGGGSAFDQVDLARHTLIGGGWLGTGLWLGTRKFALPEAHSDYIFSVIGEEFGLIACAGVVLLYLAIIARVLVRLAREEDVFTVLAGTGLVAVFGGQAFINILVNLQLFPSKGMTLPLISHGGSSTIALCLGVGLLLAITRRNPYLARDLFDDGMMRDGGELAGRITRLTLRPTIAVAPSASRWQTPREPERPPQ